MPGSVVVLSGGLDSTVCLAIAAAEEASVLAVTFDYGQRHRIELDRAAAVAGFYGVDHLVVPLDARPWGGSALTAPDIDVPDIAPAAPGSTAGAIPVTYVPARNLIFLSVAVAIAEARGADAVYIGVNALDYSGYPDCRPEFVHAFSEAQRLATRRGVEGAPIEIRTPLVDRTKAEIARLASDLGAPVHLTWSCYRSGPRPCGTCEACALRGKGFADAGLDDPALREGT